MENTNLIICIVLIVCISTFITLLMWRWFNYCSQKENLKYKEKLEKIRNEHSFKVEKLRLNTQSLKEDIEKKLKAEIKKLTKDEIDKTITEQLKDLDTQIKTLNAKNN